MNALRLLLVLVSLAWSVSAFAQDPPPVTFDITSHATPVGIDADDTLNVSGTHANAMAGKIAFYTYDGVNQEYDKIMEVDITLGENNTWSASLAPMPGDTWPTTYFVVAVSDEALPDSFATGGAVPGKDSFSGDVTAP